MHILRIRLERVTSSSIVSPGAEEAEDKNVELQNMAEKAQKDVEEKTFHWQEKGFSQVNIKTYQK